MQRAQLTAIVRLLAGIGLLLLVLVFLRACLSPPQLPGERLPPTPYGAAAGSGTLPERY